MAPPPPDPAAQPVAPIAASDDGATTGLDLIETPAQRYARVYGDCDFNDPGQPSWLERAPEVDFVIDVRDPRKVGAPLGWSRRDAPQAFAGLVQRLGKLDAFAACAAGYPASTMPINSGSSAGLKIFPKQAPGHGVRVELDMTPESTFTRCVAQRIELLSRGLRIDQPIRIAVIGPDAAFSNEQQEPTLDKQLIRRVIHQNIDDVRACYETAIEVWPEIEGSVAVRFVIASKDGRVLEARVVADAIGQPAVACCIARSVHGWQFPGNGAKGITIVTYPFNLEQREQAD